MKDADPQMRIQAIRASETLYKAGDRSFAADYRAAAKDATPTSSIQAMLTLEPLQRARPKVVVKAAHGREQGRVACSTSGPDPESAAATSGVAAAAGAAASAAPSRRRRRWRAATTIYKELCFSCHGDDGTRRATGGGRAGSTMAPSLAGSTRVLGHRDYVIKALLTA